MKAFVEFNYVEIINNHRKFSVTSDNDVILFLYVLKLIVFWFYVHMDTDKWAKPLIKSQRFFLYNMKSLTVVRKYWFYFNRIDTDQ